jgi:hypothetical protein
MPSFLNLQTSACDGLKIKTACGRNFAAWKNQLVVLAKQLSVGVLTRQWSIFDNKLVLTVTEAPQHSTLVEQQPPQLELHGSIDHLVRLLDHNNNVFFKL